MKLIGSKVTPADAKFQIDVDGRLSPISKKTYKMFVDLCMEYYKLLLESNSHDIVRYQTISQQYVNKGHAKSDWLYFFNCHYIQPFVNVLNEQLTMNCLAYLQGRLINNKDLEKGEGMSSSEIGAIKLLNKALTDRLLNYQSKGNNSVLINRGSNWNKKDPSNYV